MFIYMYIYVYIYVSRDAWCCAMLATPGNICKYVYIYIYAWLQCVAGDSGCGGRCVAVCCSVLQCVAVCCSVLQCVAVCCSANCLRAVPEHTATHCNALQHTHLAAREGRVICM